MFVIGIAGGTGSGKSTIAQARRGSAAESRRPSSTTTATTAIATISGRGARALNFDHPDSLDTELLIEHLRTCAPDARRGPALRLPPHARSAETRRVSPTPVIIVEGILVFAEERLRS